MASYEAAVGLLAPFDERLEQPDRPEHLRRKTHYCGGIGIDAAPRDREAARRKLGIPTTRDVVLVLAGGGGQGTPTAPLTLGARAEPGTQWVVIGKTFSEWHETPPGNLELRGWVDDADDWIAAADRIVSSCGNTTVHQVLATGKPWIAVPEWRYFAEQQRKAEALAVAGVCAFAPVWPSHADEWVRLWTEASRVDPALGPGFADPRAAEGAAQWLENLARKCCGEPAAEEHGIIAA
jgi:predicted glycosyltransferase